MSDLSLFDFSGRKALVPGGAVGMVRGGALALGRAGPGLEVISASKPKNARLRSELICQLAGTV